MKKILVIALCVLVQATFGNTNSLVELAKSLDDLTNGWHKLNYDKNSTATRIMCPKCVTSYVLLSAGKAVKVGKSKMKCRTFGCNQTMWYVDEWMVLNLCQTSCREMVTIAGRELYKALSSGDNKKAEYWVGKLKMATSEMEKLAVEKEKYLARKKRR